MNGGGLLTAPPERLAVATASSLDPLPDLDGVAFESALAFLRRGNGVRRRVWSGGLHLVLRGDIMQWTPDGAVAWVPTTTDLLATDWSAVW